MPVLDISSCSQSRNLKISLDLASPRNLRMPDWNSSTRNLDAFAARVHFCPLVPQFVSSHWKPSNLLTSKARRFVSDGSFHSQTPLWVSIIAKTHEVFVSDITSMGMIGQVTHLFHHPRCPTVHRYLWAKYQARAACCGSFLGKFSENWEPDPTPWSSQRPLSLRIQTKHQQKGRLVWPNMFFS